MTIETVKVDVRFTLLSRIRLAVGLSLLHLGARIAGVRMVTVTKEDTRNGRA